VPEAAARLWINLAGLPPELHQIADERYRSSEAFRCMVTGMRCFDMRDTTFTKVILQRMRHSNSPPHTLNHFESFSA
jgi:hypothetical protein